MIKKIDQLVEDFAKYSIVICVLSMLTLTLMNIVLRWFSVSLHWVEPLVRHLVFLSTFLGGTLATGSRHHIKIDLLSRVLEKSNKQNIQKIIDIIVTSITIIATTTVAYASYHLAVMEFEFGKVSFLGIHSGVLLSIIPFGMGLMTFRFCLRLLLTIYEKPLTNKKVSS